MASQSSNSVEGFLARFDNEAAREGYYNIVAAKNIWEDWLKFGRQPARANINWAREFYTHNVTGENTIVNVRGKLVPADATAINEILDLPNNDPSIYDLIEALEDIDYNTTKYELCLPGTKWNITGKNPSTISRPNLLLEAKLWNTFVKRNLMPTSHNQTVDRKRLVLIHAIMQGTKFNVVEVIAKELSEACHNDKGILAFPCLILGLCCQKAIPTRPSDKYTLFHMGWDRKHYMKKMNVADSILIKVAMPTPTPSEQAQPSAEVVDPKDPAGSPPTTPSSRHQRSTSAVSAAQGSFATAASQPAPSAPHPPSPAHSTEASLLCILQLRSQIQRIEARQIEFIAESKVFQTTLLQFLHDNFPTKFVEFPPAPTAPSATPAAINSVATPSARAGDTEEVHHSSNAELDAFDWNTPYDPPPSPPTPATAPAPPADVAESSRAQKRKAIAARIIREDHSPDPPAAADPPSQTSPTKRQRR
ncbi:hypothetical protein V6N12_013233 [Hibiscus sabdariffa]|uniref:Putative plant transposon protein domain-containing protein n=1 Tax=Hibiscus sabdariffa TaxID=183260 RepID=A0ABR2D5Z0_9ROSI